MKLSTTLTTALWRGSRGCLVALTIMSFSASGAAAQPSAAEPQGVASDDVETRTVSSAAQPCLNVRESPSYRARIVGCVDSGSSVTVTGVRRGWSYIIHEELRGWAGTRFLEGGSEPARRVEAPTEAPPAAPEPPAEPEPTRAAGPQPDEAIESTPAAPEPQAPATVSVDEFLRVSSDRDRMREQLAAAVARIEALEAESTALREMADRGAEHSGQLERMTAQLDDLARQLAQAEAQQLYLQSALEETRSELMRLKGIPPRLVQIEQPPEPEPLPVEPEPEPEAPAEQVAPDPANDLPEVVSIVSMDEVVTTVRSWAEAWSAQSADRYLSFYSTEFVPPEGASREAWAAQRRARIEAPRSITVTLDRISPIVSGDRATISFEQSYRSDSFEDVVDKTLVLERTDGLWRIVEERTR